MMKRIRQFFHAVFANVAAEDRAFLEEKLNRGQQALFFGMSVPDQCHALRTAQTAISLAGNAEGKVDFPLLTRCALLHDIGRRDGEFGIFWKCFAVLFADLFPSQAQDYGDGAHGDGVLYRKMRVYYHHAEIGAAMLLREGFAAEAEIVRRHHKAPAEDDPPELRILRMADEMN
ncbi:MAG: HDIG domain-containing protein [Schwartzia sp.]|nr:HDIG domain-containing protein [Schwartzia sp. (in: firmicutes)]MBP3690751.1 HDIG domain-containing protein [Schwartzia sp. (in: firmicutes)]